jgi:hypothetical protein
VPRLFFLEPGDYKSFPGETDPRDIWAPSALEEEFKYRQMNDYFALKNFEREDSRETSVIASPTVEKSLSDSEPHQGMRDHFWVERNV